MSCPMSNANVKKYELTDEQVEHFCNLGCSVDCEKLLQECGKRNLRRKKRCMKYSENSIQRKK